MNRQKDVALPSTIPLEVHFAETFLDRLFGMTRKRIPEAMAFRTRFGIHTVGMRFPLDVLVLDNDGYVRKLYAGLSPNSVWFWNPRFARLLELPSGTIQALAIHLASHMTLIEKNRR